MANYNTTYTRRGGSGFTIFSFGGVPIAFAQQISHQSPRLVNNPSYIQPMDEPYPLEILVPVAAGVGTLVLNLYDLWATGIGASKGDIAKVWDRLGNNGTTASGSSVTNVIPFTASDSTTQQGYVGIGGGGIFGNAADIVDIAIRQAQASPEQMRIVQYIRQIPGQGVGATGQSPGDLTKGNNVGYVEYNGCTITDVRDDETVQVNTLEIVKQITVNYTYATRGSANGSIGNWALALRNGA